MTPQTAALHGKITAIIAAGTSRDPADTAHMILDTIGLAISRQLDIAIAAQTDLLEQRGTAGLADQAHEHAIAIRVHTTDRTTLRTYLGLDQTADPTPVPPPPAAVPPALTAPPTPTSDIRHHRQPTGFTWWRRRGDPTT